MKSIQECPKHPLVWKRTKLLQAQYGLYAGEEVVGTLSKTLLGPNGDIETAEGRWQIRQEKPKPKRLIVLDSRSQTVAATSPSSQSILEWPDGRSYQFGELRRGLTTFEAALVTGGGDRLLSIREEGTLKWHRGLVQVEPGALMLPELAFLIGFTWYFMIFQAQMRAASAGSLGG